MLSRKKKKDQIWCVASKQLECTDRLVNPLSIFLNGPFNSLMAIKFIHKDTEHHRDSFKTNFPRMINRAPTGQRWSNVY